MYENVTAERTASHSRHEIQRELISWLVGKECDSCIHAHAAALGTTDEAFSRELKTSDPVFIVMDYELRRGFCAAAPILRDPCPVELPKSTRT